MKLKEIKNWMAICCTNIEQVRELDNKMKSGRCFEAFLSFPCYILTDGKKYYGWVYDKNFISSENYNPVPQIVNFSDLIIPDMSAEEVLSILYEIRSCRGRDCNQCPISDKNNGNYGYCSDNYGVRVSNNSGILEICQKCKLDHEKKEPEIEWVYRVYNGESEKFVDSEEKAISECELLTKDNQKKYAFYQKVCRVKVVE